MVHNQSPSSSNRRYSDPVDTGRILNVRKTLRRRPRRLLNVLCMFILRSVSTGDIGAFLWKPPETPLLKYTVQKYRSEKSDKNVDQNSIIFLIILFVLWDNIPSCFFLIYWSWVSLNAVYDSIWVCWIAVTERVNS